MKKRTLSLLIIVAFTSSILFISLNSCKKLDIEKITKILTDSVSIIDNIATVYGTIIDVSDMDHRDYGFCWSSSANPTINDQIKSFGSTSENGFLNFEFSDLQLNTSYFVCAYIYEGSELIYGDVVEFIITPTGIIVTSKAIIVTSASTANAKGTIEGVGSITIEDFGHCWSTNSNPTINDDKTSLGTLTSDTVDYISSLTGLSPFTKYYIRAYAKVDANNVIYGDTVTINISELTVTTDLVEITGSSTVNAVCIIGSIGVSPVINHGHCWSTSPTPTILDSHTALGAVTTPGADTSHLTGLDTNVTYYIRAFAETGSSVKYANEKTFIISPFTVSSDTVYLTSTSQADALGVLTIGSYGVSNYGHCWSTISPPTIADSKTSLGPTSQSGPYTSNLFNLLPNTIYYVRAFAKEGNTVKYGTVLILKKNYWEQMTNFGGIGRRDAVGFSIGLKGYIGTGIGSGNFLSDFWEYDKNINAWTQKASYSGLTFGAVGFSIWTKGYVGTGLSSLSLKKDFWEYDNVSNTWTAKANYGGDSISSGVGFSIGNKGYIGTGYDGISALKDFWEYDPIGNTWTQKADFGGSPRSDAVGFSIGTKGYIGMGADGPTSYNDFWEYDPGTNSWAQKANYPGSGRIGLACFAIANKGFVGLGYEIAHHDDFWEYDPGTNSWRQIADFAPTLLPINLRPRWKATGFSIDNDGYVGTGIGNSVNNNDFWKYIPVN